MIRNAVTCDRDDCLALYLEPDADPAARPGLDAEPTRAEDVLDFDQLVELAGWVARPAALVRPGLPDADVVGHLCPACAADRGPVLELGECPKCTGRTVDKADGAHCHYCRTVTPHVITDLFDDALWDGRGVINTPDGPAVGGDDRS